MKLLTTLNEEKRALQWRRLMQVAENGCGGGLNG